MTTPADTVVPVAATSATFVATVGTVNADTRVTVTATLNGTAVQTMQLLVGRGYSIPTSGGLSLTTTGSAANPTIGYARILPSSGASPAGVAILGFRQNNVLVSQAGVPATPLIRNGRIYAEIGGAVSTGIAIANPSDQAVTLNFYFTDANGANFSAGVATIAAGQQLSRFLNESPFNAPASVQGTFTFAATQPVGVIALRGYTNQRAEFLMTILPVTEVGARATETVFIPQFADGGGWTTELVLINGLDETMHGTVQFYTPGAPDHAASPVAVALDAANTNGLSYRIAPRSATKLKTTGAADAIQTGSIRIIPDVITNTPAGLAIFSLDSAGIRVSEAGVQTSSTGRRFRLYAEATTGVAMTNTSANPADVTVTLTDLEGRTVGTGTLRLPANGQTATFISEITGLKSVAAVFQGVMQITATEAVSVMGLRARYNERGDFLITTIPVADEAASFTGEQIFPHMVDGGGYTTQVILHATKAASMGGMLRFMNQSGQPAPINP